MTKDEIIYKFINEQVFPDVKWEKYNLHRSNGAYLSCNYWCKIRDMFSLSKEEVMKHFNEYIRAKIEVSLEFNVILEPTDEELYTTTRTTMMPTNII